MCYHVQVYVFLRTHDIIDRHYIYSHCSSINIGGYNIYRDVTIDRHYVYSHCSSINVSGYNIYRDVPQRALILTQIICVLRLLAQGN